MKVKFRGGPIHNKTKNVDKLSHTYRVNVNITTPVYFEHRLDNYTKSCMEYRTHYYQLGKDEKKRDTYFHIGCI